MELFGAVADPDDQGATYRTTAVCIVVEQIQNGSPAIWATIAPQKQAPRVCPRLTG